MFCSSLTRKYGAMRLRTLVLSTEFLAPGDIRRSSKIFVKDKIFIPSPL